MIDQKENTKQLLINWLNVEVLANENQKLKTLLYDETTELHTLSYYIDKIKTLLDEFEQIGLLYVDVAKEGDIERIFGWRVFDEILLYVAKSLTDLQKRTLRENDEIAVVTKNGNAFIILIAPSRKNTAPTLENLLSIRKRISEEFDINLKQRAPVLYKKFKCSIGYSFIRKTPDIRIDRLIFNSIEEAQKSIHQIKTKEKELMTEQLKEILENEKINTLLQPIINLSNNNIIGYEAFNYGPEGNLKSPRKLFWLAKESDLVCRLDKICREKAVKKAIENKSNGLLFININLDAIGSPVFKEFLDSKSFNSNEIPHDKIVFEVSEQSAITNTDLFQMTFNYLKSMGFKTAIDDAGSGYYTNLQMINKIKPDFVKIDIPLIRDIDKDIIKQELVSTIVKLSSRSDIKTIAEGIETSIELETLRDLNVQYGQGYFIAYPS